MGRPPSTAQHAVQILVKVPISVAIFLKTIVMIFFAIQTKQNNFWGLFEKRTATKAKEEKNYQT